MLARHVSDLTGPPSGAFCTSCITTYESLRIQLVQNAPDDGPVRSETWNHTVYLVGLHIYLVSKFMKIKKKTQSLTLVHSPVDVVYTEQGGFSSLRKRTPQIRLNICGPAVTRHAVCFNSNSVFCHIVYMQFLVRLSEQTAIIPINSIKRLNLLCARTAFSVRYGLNRYV